MAVDSDDDEDEERGAFPKLPPPSFLDPSDVSPADVKVMVPGRGFTTFSVSGSYSNTSLFATLLPLAAFADDLVLHTALACCPAVLGFRQASPMRQSDANKQALRELVAALHGTGSEGEGVLCAEPSAKTGLVVVAL